MTRITALCLALLALSACDSGSGSGDDPGTTLTTAQVQGQWQRSGAVERVSISGATFRGGDTSDLCFAPTVTGTLSGGTSGTLSLGSGATGSVSLSNGNLVVSGVTDNLGFNYNGTYTRAADPIADC